MKGWIHGSYGVKRHLQQYFQLYRGSQFYLWKKPEKTTDLSQVIVKLYHIMMDARSGNMILNVH